VSGPATPDDRRSAPGRAAPGFAGRVLGVLFALSAASDLVQVAGVLAGRVSQPAALAAEHALAGLAGAAAAVGLWRGARWAAGAVAAWGLFTTVLLLTLPAVLDLPREARPGIWLGAAITGLVAAAVALWAWRRGRGLGRSGSGSVRRA
jgi:hypothetical protein